MQTITYADAVAACRKAMDDGTLLALAYERGTAIRSEFAPSCVYDDGKGHKCAIGVALSPESLADIEGHDALADRVLALVRSGLLAIPSEDTFKLDRLQQAHDEWVRQEGEEAKATFCDLIGHPL